ncbi:hypothetical protein CVT26_006082 [Gymnopilus dilepis]|uniref:Uncharacterized protein n=1 Tax=Gymnopilus dilepis TaxID=231916 RepID=A0A409VQ50_9AGAR|nr:hypothetical protein CVT26_006082 [Gymnopilus dilepis]
MSAMNLTQPEKRRVRVSSGTLPSPKISSIAAFHPFSQQLDVVFPLDSALLNTLEALQTEYGKARAKLSDVFTNADAFCTGLENGSDILVLSAGSQGEEDLWCIDPRGHLTLSVCKSTYERLGLVGQKLPFRNHQERHVIDIPLQRNVMSPANRERQRTSIGLWDQRRESELGRDAAPWEIVYSWKGKDEPPNVPFQGHTTHKVQCKKRQMPDVHIPTPSLSPRPLPQSKSKGSKSAENDEDDALEDWNLHIESLFEWVGMACLGAQRLRANDRVDPFVALYEPPEPSSIGTVVHLQWRGLLHSSFVQQVIDSVLPSLFGINSSLPFVSITCHALTSSPVSYLPYSYTITPTGGLQPPKSVPPKLPRADGEDTWSLILERGSGADTGAGHAADAGPVKWCLAESIGQWDTRWG